VLHGVWRPETCGGSFYLWAEHLDEDRAFSLNAEELHERVALLQGQPEPISLLLPTVDGRALTSNEGAEEAVLAPVQIDALCMPPVDAMFQLLTLDPEERMGDDLRFWQIAARFTLELLARERYVPAINDKNVALWQPVLTGNDRNRFARMARSMPPVCRALLPQGAPPSGTTVLESFLQATVDSLCRQSLQRWEPSVPARVSQGNRAQAYIWLLSLTRPRDEPTTIKIDQRLRSSVKRWLEPLQIVANEAFKTVLNELGQNRSTIEAMHAVKPESPLDGSAIMALTGLKPSPAIGQIKTYLLNLVLDDELAADDAAGAEQRMRAFMHAQGIGSPH